jgi:hypothetical protein
MGELNAGSVGVVGFLGGVLTAPPGVLEAFGCLSRQYFWVCKGCEAIIPLAVLAV